MLNGRPTSESKSRSISWLNRQLTRVPELVPIRYGRMAATPFTYYRGAALPMAADLSTGPRTSLDVQLCGDAHLSNFGGFASPERDLLFDVNDFDETSPGPFEWDLKRLGASFEIAARSRNFPAKTGRKLVMNSMSAYREAMHEFAKMSNLEVWYSRLDMAGVAQRWGSEVSSEVLAAFQKTTTKAESKDQLKAREKLTEVVDGELRFRSDPPLLVRLSELSSDTDAGQIQDMIHESIRSYRETLIGDRRHLLESYELVDVARKVVGVGSVGTRAWVALFRGDDADDTLILQIKEAEASVLERFCSKSVFKNHGQRVVEGQRFMQAASDIFLGWHRVPNGFDGNPHDYYFRQLWDWKLSADVDNMPPEAFSSTRKCVAGHWLEPTPDLVTGWPSLRTLGLATPSTGLSPTSPSPTPTRMRSTSKRSSTPSRTARFKQSLASSPPTAEKTRRLTPAISADKEKAQIEAVGPADNGTTSCPTS